VTTIVANADGMASDSQLMDAHTKASVRKFWKVRGWLIGAAGTFSEVVECLAEVKGQKSLSPLQVLSDVDIKVKDVDMLLLSPAGKLYISENGRDGMPITDKFAAIGTGAQGALVAMHLGCTPAEAVRAVKKVDPNTGGRVVTRKL